MPKRILYLSQWFAPENTTKSKPLVLGLVDQGYDVEVLTGFPNYPTGRLAPGYKLKPYSSETLFGVRVHRVFLYPSHDRSSLRRAVNYGSFFFSALIFCLVRGRKFDAIYVYHPPITVGLAAAISGLITRRPFILEVQDLWPDSVAVSGMAGAGWMSSLLKVLCNFTYRRASRVLAQSRSMTRQLIARGVPPSKVDTVFNWADEEAIVPTGRYDVAPLSFDGHFNIVYGGNLGRVQSLDKVIHAAQRAAEVCPHIQLTLIGDGVEREQLASLVQEIGASNVNIRSAIPKSSIADVFTEADVLLVHLMDDPLFEVAIPSKIQFYMAMGKPILIGVRGEASDIVVSANCGISVEPDNIAALANAMVQLARMPQDRLLELGSNGRRAYVDNFSYARGMSVIGENIRIALEANVNPKTGS